MCRALVFVALALLLPLSLLPSAAAQDAGPDAAPLADASPDVATTPDVALDAAPSPATSPDTADTDQPDSDHGLAQEIADLPEPFRSQVLACQSDDVDAVLLALELSPDALSTEARVNARIELVQSEHNTRDAELSRLNGQLDALRDEITAIEHAATGPPTTHGGAMLDAVRLDGLRRHRQHLQTEADGLSNRLYVIQTELAFYDRHMADLHRQVDLRTTEEQRAVDNRAAAEREKAKAAEAREVTQRRLQQAEAERDDTTNVEDEYRELANLEPRILEEKLYIEARRQFELSAQLEDLGNASSAFTTYKSKVDQTIATLEDRLERREGLQQTQAEARALYRELNDLRSAARGHVVTFDRPARSIGDSTRDVRSDIDDARDAVQRLTRIAQDNRDDRLARKRLSVAQARLQRLIADELLLELKRQVLTGGQELAFEQLLFARDRQQRLHALLADDDLDALRAMNTANIASAPSELADFALATRHYISARLAQAGEIGEQALSFDGLIWIFKLVVVVGAMVFAIRFIRRRREEWLLRFSDWAMKQRAFRRRRNLVVKFFEVLNAVLMPVSVLILMQFALSLFPENAPMVVIATVLINSTLIYMITINIIKTMILPRWYRVAEDRAIQTDSPTDSAADFVPSGEDLLDLNVQVALFGVSTLRLMLLYTLICQYSLYLVRSALGDFFIAHWIAVLGYLGYVVVVYVLLSRWKDAIAARFASLVRARSPQAVEFVTTRKDAFYGVGVIFGALLYVLGKEGYERVRRYFSGLEAANQIRNFFFRKRIEMNAEAAGPTAEPRIDALPEEYRRYFTERPLIDEPWYVPRKGAFDAVQAVRQRWKDKAECASVVIYGELGMGKTTLLNQLRIAWEEDGDPVTHASMPARITTERQVLNFLARLLGTDDAELTTDAVVQRALELPPTTLLIDDCHNVFMRKISGFVALDAFRKIVRLTDQHHCWVLVFNRYAWRYIEQVTDTSKLFGHGVPLEPLTEAEIRELVEARTNQTPWTLDFSRLILEEDGSEDQWLEVSRSARGYYRLLGDHARGNPRIALHYWQRSLTVHEAQLQVTLFHPSAIKELSRLNDPLKFALAAIVQHDALTVEELAEVVNCTLADAVIAMNYFLEHGLVELDRESRRAHLTAALFRQTLSHLGANNFLPK